MLPDTVNGSLRENKYTRIKAGGVSRLILVVVEGHHNKKDPCCGNGDVDDAAIINPAVLMLICLMLLLCYSLVNDPSMTIDMDIGI